MNRVGKSVDENGSNLNSDGVGSAPNPTPGKKGTRASRIPKKRKIEVKRTKTPIKRGDGKPGLPVVNPEEEQFSIKVKNDDVKIGNDNGSEISLGGLEDFHYEHGDPVGTSSFGYPICPSDAEV